MRETVYEWCNVTVIGRERGKKKFVREGHNVWTTVGREYSCLLKSYNNNGQPFRSDRIRYVGVGTGTQVESVSVSSLVSPVAWQAGTFLKEIQFPLTSFPNPQVRTSVRYVTKFDEAAISLAGNLVEITECGLFTDGAQEAPFSVGGRNLLMNAAAQQSPVAYHTFDPIPKTPNLELDIIWELRH